MAPRAAGRPHPNPAPNWYFPRRRQLRDRLYLSAAPGTRFGIPSIRLWARQVGIEEMVILPAAGNRNSLSEGSGFPFQLG